MKQPDRREVWLVDLGMAPALVPGFREGTRGPRLAKAEQPAKFRSSKVFPLLHRSTECDGRMAHCPPLG